MALTDYKINGYDGKDVASASDRLTGSVAENKAVFDRLVKELLEVKYNALIDALGVKTAAEYIGADVLSVTEKTLSAVLMFLDEAIKDRYNKAQIDSMFGVNTSSLVHDVTLDTATGILTVTKKDGTALTTDTNLEKIPASLAVVQVGNEWYLRVTNDDGSYTETSVTNLWNSYVFNNTAQVVFTVVSNANNSKTVTATIGNSSVRLTNLHPEIVAELEAYKAHAADSAALAASAADRAAASELIAKQKATAAAASELTAIQKAIEAGASAAAALADKNTAVNAAADATDKQKLSQSYAIGGTGIRVGEATDNAKYYKEQAALTKADVDASKTAVLTSEARVKASETASKTSETNSKASEVAALNSKNIAEQARTDAEASAGAAQQRADEAATDAGTAVNAANLATEKAGLSLTEANRATTEADRAKAEADRAGEIVGGDFLTKSGDGKDLTVSELVTQATRVNVVAGDKMAVLFGKIAKFFSDLKAVAFTGSYTDLSNQPASLPANGGNADTVGGKTVLTNVPDGAKFTDTVYTHPGTHPASMITGLPEHLSNTNNPHGVTKELVGLDSVGNYGLATQAEAEAGTSSAKYMTPLGTKQAIAKLASGKKYATFVVGLSGVHGAASVDYLADNTVGADVAINAAITALPATGGNIVILEGTYDIKSQIALNKSNVIIEGVGNATALKRMHNPVVEYSPEGVINLSDVAYCAINNLQIIGNKAQYADFYAAGITVKNSNHIIISNTLCNNNQNSGISLYAVSNSLVLNNYCWDNEQNGIADKTSFNNKISYNRCVNNYRDNISLINSDYLNYTMIANNFCDTTRGTGSYGISVKRLDFGIIQNNTIVNSVNTGLAVQLSKNTLISNNTCANNGGSGISLFYSCQNNTITGNSSIDNMINGFAIATTTNTIIIGNTALRGTGLLSDYLETQNTIKLSGVENNNNLISSNNCMGKAIVIEGGTGNTEVNNKYN